MGADVGVKDEANSEPNVVPLCDILLVLLIIFMVVTPMLSKGVHVTLPDAAFTQDEPEPGKMITVFIKEDSTVHFKGTLVEDISKLASLIEDEMEESKPEDRTKILLKADKECVYGKIVDVMHEVKGANIEVVGLVTDKVARN